MMAHLVLALLLTGWLVTLWFTLPTIPDAPFSGGMWCLYDTLQRRPDVGCLRPMVEEWERG